MEVREHEERDQIQREQERGPAGGRLAERGAEQIEKWLGDGKWDVIHFNFGLHDLKFVDEKGMNTSPEKGKLQVPIEDYKKNLDALVSRMKKTGAKLIFATTTPVPAGEPQRHAIAGPSAPQCVA